VLVTIDGAAAPVIEDAIRRGVMPKLAKLRASGAFSREGSLSSLPIKTPAGHAALYTGAWSDRNGIAGIDMSVPGASVLTEVSGFSTEMLRAEPLWVTAARQGLHATVVSATQTWPFAPFQEEKRFGGNYGWRLTLFDGYEDRKTAPVAITGKDVKPVPAAGWLGNLPAHRGALKDFEITVAGTRLEGLAYDDPEDPVDGFDTLYVSTSKRAGTGVALKPSPPRESAEGFQGLTVRTDAGSFGLHLRLYALTPDGSDLLLVAAESSIIHSNRPVLEAAALRATGGFVGNGADDLYKDGALGPPIWRGGDGTAEARYLETAHLVERQFRRFMDFGLDATQWDVLVGYLPFPDEQLHLWYGYLDPALRGHDPGVAGRLAPFLDKSLALADAYVGHLLERLPADAILAVGTDHGIGSANRTVNFNVALERAGLLTLTRDGAVDLHRTQALYFPGNSSYFLINRVGRKEGIVRPEEEPRVVEKLKAALRAILDPETDEPVVTAILDPADGSNEPAIGGPNGGDLYVDLAPGYYSSSALRGEVVTARRPSGEHLFGPQRAELRGAFALTGPGVAKGGLLGPIRQIDIAPTLAVLLGIAPPAQSQGSVLREALAR
jgi:predicted AlkP superfamily phosphohydrolase/phosphomutase